MTKALLIKMPLWWHNWTPSHHSQQKELPRTWTHEPEGKWTKGWCSLSLPCRSQWSSSCKEGCPWEKRGGRGGHGEVRALGFQRKCRLPNTMYILEPCGKRDPVWPSRRWIPMFPKGKEQIGMSHAGKGKRNEMCRNNQTDPSPHFSWWGGVGGWHPKP